LKIEVDSSDLEWGTLYKDEKCKELERVLQSDSRYAEYEVKRVHWGDANTNPFDVLGENEVSIVLLRTWEVSALSPSELLSYIEVKQRIDKPEPETVAMVYGAFMALCFTSVVLLILMAFFGSAIGMDLVAVLIYILTPILGIISFRTYQKSMDEKKNIDLEAARQDRSFIEILQKFTQAPEIDERSRRKIIKRIESLEKELMGIES